MDNEGVMQTGWKVKISDTALGEGKTLVTYRFTDLYGANHWTQTIQR